MREEQAMEENPYQVHIDEFFHRAAMINKTLLQYGIDLFAESAEPPPPPRERWLRKVTPERKMEWIVLLRQLDDFYPGEPDFHPQEEAAGLEANLVRAPLPYASACMSTPRAGAASRKA